MESPDEQLALHLRRLRLRHFEILLAVARHGSLTATAQALDCGQPAVSQWLAEIEAAVGVTLFVRGRQLKPTPHLAPVLRHARRMLADSRRLELELAAVARGAHGLLRIGCMTGPSLDLLPHALLALHAEGTAPHFEVVEDIAQGLWERFARRELDLIVGRLDERAYAPGLAAEPLYAEPHCVVAGRHHALGHGPVDWPQAAAWPWILPPRHTMLRRAVDASFLAHALAPPVPWLETGAPGLVQRLLQASDCLAVVSGASGRHHAALGVLQVLGLRLTVDVGPVGMAWTADDDSPALQRMLQALRACARARTPPAAPASVPTPARPRRSAPAPAAAAARRRRGSGAS